MDDKSSGNQRPADENAKQEQLDQYRITNKGKPLTTNVGRKISNDQDQLKAVHADLHYVKTTNI